MAKEGRLEITTRMGCKINCVYCPQKLLTGRYYANGLAKNTELSLENFQKCVDKVPRGTRIDFSGMAEPWLNDQCTDMVCYAANKGLPIAIYTTLVGMTESDFCRIRDLKFEEFVLHIPDDKSNAHIDINQEYIELLHAVIEYKRDNGTSLVTGFSCHAGIHPAIRSAIPPNSKLITELIDRAGNVEGDCATSKKNEGKILCVNCGGNINNNVLLPDGTVVLCCMDYGMKHVLGNLLEQDYDAILHSNEAEMIRFGLGGGDCDILCRNCTNARNIYELYNDFEIYRDWVRKQEIQLRNDKKDLDQYKQWVHNLEQKKKIGEQEIKEWSDRYDDRMKELYEYKDWVNNLIRQLENKKNNV